MLLIAGSTAKLTPLLATPPAALTTTLPVVAPLGTVTPMLVLPHELTVAAVPLNVTPPLPCVAPKLVPVIVIAAPTDPAVADKLVMLGADTTVNVTPALATPPTVTTTFPVVAPVGTVAVMLLPFQAVVVAVVPLNFTVLVPCVAPKFVPAITIDEPTAPLFGVRLVMLGAPPGLMVTAMALKVVVEVKLTVSIVPAAAVVSLYSARSPCPLLAPAV
jgi:hypothetical protein